MNHLARESSPYLLQHADNPVEWRPWNNEALNMAVRQDKPILLSIGYSACHWCHVMAHESFEDEATAEVMNEHFVNIKVDREERPDLDKIYQLAHQLLTQRGGGWPLTLFLTPVDCTPFFGGTYFPREARYGLPAFRDLLQQVADYHRHHKDEIQQQNGKILTALKELVPCTSDAVSLDAVPLDIAVHQLLQSFDKVHGGFGSAPKFPQPANLERLLLYWHASNIDQRTHAQAFDMVRHTLTNMAAGGMYDHLGGGFCRYAVDERWMIPHFEKMLYDNALLLPLFTWVQLVTKDPQLKQVLENTATETADWVMREMQSPQGGYYAALDADSEGEEGKFYAWDKKEVQGLLTAEEYAVFSQHFGLDQAPNFEGSWHLHRACDIDEIARQMDFSPARVATLLETSREILFEHRSQRVRPGRDDKILTAWNALMIRGMTITARHLGKPEYLASATRALDFIHAHLWRDGRLLVSSMDGRSHLAAYLDDYAFLIDAILELLQVQWRDQDLSFAIMLADILLNHFQDTENGGFYFTADDHEQLLYRPKPFGDDAIPSGNGIAAKALGRLGHLVGSIRYLNAAEHTLKGGWSSIMQLPYGHNTLLSALEEYLEPTQMIILRGSGPALARWLQRCNQAWVPHRLTFAIPDNATCLTGVLSGYKPIGEVVAYICTGTNCLEPVTTFETLEQILTERECRDL